MLRGMFKHILIPTDGSKLAAKGVKAGINLARALGARATALYVIPPFLPVMYGGLDSQAQGAARRSFERNSESAAKLALAAVETQARAAGVRCTTRSTTDPEPWGGILRVAHAARCDAIVMASHGRGGIGGLILGSETQRVLARSKIPVLVVR
jgi:nucleotide-binding universal stress UspA family protein